MKPIPGILLMVTMIGVTQAADKKPAPIQWKPNDCSSPLLLPEGQFSVSMFGKGKYRIDGRESEGRVNCIYMVFKGTDSLDPVAVPDARESFFTVKGRKVTWRTYKTTVEGRSVIRKETLMPNLLPRQKQGNDSDYIWLWIDADSQEILDRLTSDAEGVIRDAAEPAGPEKGSRPNRSAPGPASSGAGSRR